MINSQTLHQTDTGTYLTIGEFAVALVLDTDDNGVESLSVVVCTPGTPVVTNYVCYEGDQVGAVYTRKRVDNGHS